MNTIQLTPYSVVFLLEVLLAVGSHLEISSQHMEVVSKTLRMKTRQVSAIKKICHSKSKSIFEVFYVGKRTVNNSQILTF